MHLDGSCHCKAVTFTVAAYAPFPYMRCYCTICRKTAGGGGYAINLGAHFATLTVTGRENIRIYRGYATDDTTRAGTAERHFCGICGSALWVWDARWPDLVHPHASAIDTPLPIPPENAHIMLPFKADWVAPHIRPGDAQFDAYPDASLAAWHKARGLAD
jgi:hypothetical protein